MGYFGEFDFTVGRIAAFKYAGSHKSRLCSKQAILTYLSST